MGINIRHCARSAFRPAVVDIQPLLGSFHWSAFRRSAFGHAPADASYYRLPIIILSNCIWMDWSRKLQSSLLTCV